MLEKEPGAPWIHRLRIIELFDAQTNAGFQLFVGRTMMRHAVNNGLLCEESFRSTPGKMAALAVIQKMVAIDQLRIVELGGYLIVMQVGAMIKSFLHLHQYIYKHWDFSSQ